MQNRGALWIFTILLALACLWQLSFSFFTGRVERTAANEATYKVDSVLNVAGNGGLDRDSLFLQYESRYLRQHGSDPIYLGYTYDECKAKEINLGLDLKGGMAVTLEVSIPELIVNLADNSENEAFRTAIANARGRQAQSTEDFITLFAEEFSKADPNGKLAAIFHSPERKDMFPREASNDEIVEALRREARTAVDNTEKILRTRIDKFGVAQPSIQKQQFSGRIQIELPGVKDKDRVRKVLQSTANLEFWETYENADVYPLLEQANGRLSAVLHPELEQEGDTTDAVDALLEGGDFSHTLPGGVSISGNAGGVEQQLVRFINGNRPVDKTTWFDFDRVTFASSSAELDPGASKAQLDNLKEILTAHPAVRLKIGGYTDSTGNEEANQQLSQARAEAVVAALVDRGVEADRLEAEGYGSQHPVASNATPEGRAQNRRMALRVLDKGDGEADDLLNELAGDTGSGDVLDTAQAQADFAKQNPLFAVMRRQNLLRGRLAELLRTENARLEAQVAARTTELSQLARYLTVAREAEKESLARELHDELGALLTAAKLDAGWMRRKLPPELREQWHERIERLLHTLSSGIALKRRLIDDLRPPLLKDLGLIEARCARTSRWTARSGSAASCRRRPTTSTRSMPWRSSASCRKPSPMCAGTHVPVPSACTSGAKTVWSGSRSATTASASTRPSSPATATAWPACAIACRPTPVASKSIRHRAAARASSRNCPSPEAPLSATRRQPRAPRPRRNRSALRRLPTCRRRLPRRAPGTGAG